MAQLSLPFGHGSLSVNIPDTILGEVVSPKPVKAAADPEAVIRAALDQPIGALPLEQIAQPGQQVAVIIDDITRETPTHLMLPPVLECLARASVSREAIKVVIALGTHRPMTEEEILVKVGPAIAHEFEIINVSCWDESQFVYLGASSKGIPAWVNRAVAEADVRIGLGGVTPHTDAGYSGGAKIILPGVCSGRTVDAFHVRGAAIHANLLGTVEGPLRRDLEQFVGERVGLDFVLNAVLTREGELYQCVAGHFIQAHRAGVQLAQQVYGVMVSRRYPLVIANAFPAELDLWQTTKGLWSGELMVNDGGTLILVTPCPEGINIHPLYADYMNLDPDELQAELDAGRVEDPNACAGAILIGRMKRRIKLGLVSSGLGQADADRMGFIYFDSVEAAIAAELDGSALSASVGVLTHGGFTIPFIVSPETG
jgi:nickel-dependent lactate racemase